MMPALSEIDPIRGYIITLRRAQDKTQQEVATAAGMARRSYIAWETGETAELKFSVAQTIVRFLGGSLAHLEIASLGNVDGVALAEQWLALDETARRAWLDLAAQWSVIQETAQREPEKLRRLVRQLRDDAEHDPALVDFIEGVLAGRRSTEAP